MLQLLAGTNLSSQLEAQSLPPSSLGPPVSLVFPGHHCVPNTQRKWREDRLGVSPGMVRGEDRRLWAWRLKELVINCHHKKTAEEDE